MDFAMNPYSIPNFTVAIYTLALGLFTFYANPKSRKNQLCFLLTSLCFLWQGAYGLVYLINDYDRANLFSFIGHGAVIFLTPVVYYLILEILGTYKKRVDLALAKFSMVFSVISSILFWYPASHVLYIPKLQKHYWGYYPLGGPLMLLYALWTFVVVFRTLFLLWDASKKAKGKLQYEDYQRFKFYCLSLCIFVLCATDYLPKFGFDVYPFGFVFVAAFASLASYGIVRHSLFDIDIVIKRSFVYSLLISIITFLYLLLILISEFFFRSFFGYQSIIIAVVMSSVVAATFNPLRLRIQKFLDKHFFKIDPDKLMEENVKLKDAVQNQDRLKAVATLAAGMAHEVKNPLTSIRTFAEYLPQKYDDPDFRQKFKRIVVDEVDRVNSIVTQLLEFSKPKELELKEYIITEILDETLGFLSSHLLKNKIEVQKDYRESPRLLVDKNQLKQAFLNIFLNSIQAMSEGGLLRVGVSSPKEGSCRISVTDSGLGIPKEQLGHIFDPFFTTRESGTGLGLSIVHGIISKHGGTIEAHSEAGQGATISVVLRSRSSCTPAS